MLDKKDCNMIKEKFIKFWIADQLIEKTVPVIRARDIENIKHKALLD